MRATQGLLDLYAAYASEEACCREAWDQGEDRGALYRADQCADVMYGMLRAAEAMGVDPEEVKASWLARLDAAN